MKSVVLFLLIGFGVGSGVGFLLGAIMPMSPTETTTVSVSVAPHYGRVEDIDVLAVATPGRPLGRVPVIGTVEICSDTLLIYRSTDTAGLGKGDDPVHRDGLR